MPCTPKRNIPGSSKKIDEGMTNELKYRARLWELYFFLYGVLQHLFAVFFIVLLVLMSATRFINALFLKVGMFGRFLA